MEYILSLLIFYATLLGISFLFNKRKSKLERFIHHILYYIPCSIYLIIYFNIFLIMYLLNKFLTSRLFFRPMKLEDCPVGEENKISTILTPLDILFQVADEDFVSADGLFKLKGEFSVAKFKDTLVREFTYAKDSKGRLLYPKLTQIVKMRTLYATWEYHPNFNIDDHVIEKRIDLSVNEELNKFLTEITLNRIPANRPGFQFFVLHDKHTTQYTEDTMTYVVYRLDHTMGDGLTFVRVFMNTLGKPATEEDKTRLEALLHKFGKSPQLISFRNLALLTILSPIYLSDFIEFEPANFYKSSTVSRRKCFAHSPPLDFKKISAIKRITKTTVNDVYIMLLGQAMQAYMLEKGENPTSAKFVSFVQAVSLNVSLENSNMSNNFVGVRVKVPVSILNWKEQLNEIHSDMLKLKTSLMPLFNLLMILAFSYTPKYIRIQSQRMLFRCFGTGTLTNVPGPDVKMTLGDVPIEGLAVFMPLTGSLSIGIAFLTYGDKLTFTISTDGSMCTEPEVIVSHFVRKLDDIYQSACSSL